MHPGLTIPTRTRTTGRERRHRHARARSLAEIARHAAVDLTPQAVEQVAIRVAQLLRHTQQRERADATVQTGWMTVKELAAHLKLNPAWVYEHAEELGAIRVGDGPKARLRFDLRTATQALKRHQRQEPVSAPTPHPRRAPKRPEPYAADAPLLKIRNPYARGVRACFARTRSHGRVGVL
jgi:hypothetical protein